MDQEVIQTVLKDVLPNLLQKYILDDTIPVVVGGVPLNKCANDTDSLINDVDIKFICSDSRDTSYNKVHRHRMAFVKEVISEYNTIAKLKNLPSMKSSKLRKQYSWRVEIGYMSEGTFRTIIDTGIILSKSGDKPFNKYILLGNKYKKLSFKSSDFIVPFDVVNDIPYASCKWMYIDTIRILYDSLDNYNKNTDSVFWKMKVLKYIHKYISISNEPKLKSLDAKIRPLLNKETLIKNKLNIGKFIKTITNISEVSTINSILRNSEIIWDDYDKAHKIIMNLIRLYPSLELLDNGSKLKGDSKTRKQFLDVLKTNLQSNLESVSNIVIKKSSLQVENIPVLTW